MEITNVYFITVIRAGYTRATYNFASGGANLSRIILLNCKILIGRINPIFRTHAGSVFKSVGLFVQRGSIGRAAL